MQCWELKIPLLARRCDRTLDETSTPRNLQLRLVHLPFFDSTLPLVCHFSEPRLRLKVSVCLLTPSIQVLNRLPPHFELQFSVNPFAAHAAAGFLRKFELTDMFKSRIQTTQPVNDSFFEGLESLWSKVQP